MSLSGIINNVGADSNICHVKSSPTHALETPSLVDDSYLNLISWNENNILAVALGDCVWFHKLFDC